MTPKLFQYKTIPGKGLGLVTAIDVAYGAVIDRSPAEVLEPNARDYLSITDLGEMLFVDPEQFDPDHPMKPCRAFDLNGPGTYCNHSDNPNAEMQWDWFEGQLWGSLVALSFMARNTEIQISYTDIVLYQDRHKWVA